MVKASAFSSADASRLTALLQSSQQSEDAETDEEAVVGAPASAVYKGHSGNIIETLESLLEKAQEQLLSARKTETSNLRSFEMLKQAIEDEIKFGTQDMEKAKAGLAESGEVLAKAEGDLTVTSKDLAGDLKDL